MWTRQEVESDGEPPSEAFTTSMYSWAVPTSSGWLTRMRPESVSIAKAPPTLPELMEYVTLALTPRSLSMANMAVTTEPTAAVSKMRTWTSSDMNSGVWSLWSVTSINRRAKLRLDGVPWSLTDTVNKCWAIVSLCVWVKQIIQSIDSQSIGGKWESS